MSVLAKNIVLMIDDDNDTLEIYRLLIEKTPHIHQFITKSNPYQALNWLREQANSPGTFPRYILLDLNMPELDGMEFLQRFEQQIDYQKLNTEVIVLTSSVRERDQREALQYASVSQFISKPLSKKKLVELLAADQ
ncbi:MAG: response regulator [Bacteroidota bacterium]